jgi:hypothetical protein
MPNKDYIPTTGAGFLEWSENLLKVSTANKAAWGLKDEKLARLQALHDDYAAALARSQSPNRGKIDVLRKNETEAVLKTEERGFVKSSLAYNEAVSDIDRESLRITIHDKTPSTHPVPDTLPDVEIETPLPREVQIKFRQSFRPTVRLSWCLTKTGGGSGCTSRYAGRTVRRRRGCGAIFIARLCRSGWRLVKISCNFYAS